MQRNIIQYNRIYYNTIQYSTIQYNKIQCNSNTIQYNTIQYKTIQHTFVHDKLWSMEAPMRVFLQPNQPAPQGDNFDIGLFSITRINLREMNFIIREGKSVYI